MFDIEKMKRREWAESTGRWSAALGNSQSTSWQAFLFLLLSLSAPHARGGAERQTAVVHRCVADTSERSWRQTAVGLWSELDCDVCFLEAFVLFSCECEHAFMEWWVSSFQLYSG